MQVKKEAWKGGAGRDYSCTVLPEICGEMFIKRLLCCNKEEETKKEEVVKQMLIPCPIDSTFRIPSLSCVRHFLHPNM